MSKVCDEDVTANALALAIFRDNLDLHKKIDGLRQYIEELRDIICQYGIPSRLNFPEHRDKLCGFDLWNWYNGKLGVQKHYAEEAAKNAARVT